MNKVKISINEKDVQHLKDWFSNYVQNTAGFSDEVYQDLMKKRIVDIKHLQNLNDFKLLQMGWVLDVNFEPTFRCIKSRHYMEMISQVLPESEKIEKIFAVIEFYLNEKEKHCLCLDK